MIHWSLELSTAPTLEPVTLGEAREHVVLATADDDAWLDARINEARKRVEAHSGKALLTQTWKLRLDRFPPSGVIRLPMPPLASVTSIAYTDTDGASQTLSSALYTVSAYTEPGHIVPAYGESWPSIRYQAGVPAVTVMYVAGETSQGHHRLIPARRAIVDLVALWYEHREGTVEFATVHLVTDIEERILAGRLDADFTCYHDFGAWCG